MVSDDGRGFDEAKAFNKKSFGLFMMKDLMNSLGGSFNISKGEPQGTIIDCVVPVKRDVK
jgi:signal transduction histidine kinase